MPFLVTWFKLNNYLSRQPCIHANEKYKQANNKTIITGGRRKRSIQHRYAHRGSTDRKSTRPSVTPAAKAYVELPLTQTPQRKKKEEKEREMLFFRANL
jgi:hypothetical protein